MGAYDILCHNIETRHAIYIKNFILGENYGYKSKFFGKLL